MKRDEQEYKYSLEMKAQVSGNSSWETMHSVLWSNSKEISRAKYKVDLEKLREELKEDMKAQETYQKCSANFTQV